MEINIQNLRKNLSKEIRRLLKILQSREREFGVSQEKYGYFIKPLSIFLRIKKGLREKAIGMLECLDLSGMRWGDLKDDHNEDRVNWTELPPQSEKMCVGFDHNDWYNALNAVSYDFGGINFVRRVELLSEINKDYVDKMVK